MTLLSCTLPSGGASGHAGLSKVGQCDEILCVCDIARGMS